MIEKPISDDGTNEESRAKITNDPGTSGGLFSDPDYKQLMDTYQQAHFDECEELLKTLFARYTDHPRLVEFKKDIEMQLSLRQLEHKHEKVARTKKVRKTLRMSAFTIFSIVVVLAIFAGSYFVLSNLVSQGTNENKNTQIVQLEQQANDLLSAGQPAVAAELVARIRVLDAEYPGLIELETRTNTLLELDGQYQSALNLLAEGKDSEALTILLEIESKSPGLWDVNKRITEAEEGIQIAAYMEQGDQAYQDEDWRSAIDAYEAALALNPDLDDPLFKEQLLNSYLRSIIQMLESSSTTVEDIGLAEQYYRKAVAMIPQSRAFASERGNLEQVSSNLLQLKYTQTANALLEEPNQTFSSISSAVSYLNKAVNLDPKNVNLQATLKSAQLYQVAFQNVIEMDWNQAVKNLNQLVSGNPGYAAGNASQLLLQAYYELGKKYYDVGLYTDARGYLEQAEILAFDKSENKLQLYQVQMTLGDIIARTMDFENAASYYRYAFNKVNVFNKAPADSRLYILVNAGNSLMDQGDYELAVESFQQAGEEIDEIITMKTVNAPDGTTLPLFAAENFSTTQAIISANRLPQSMTITFGRELQVPTIE
jgi:tetratricopeptide (TPR) repeat protein